MDWNYLYYGCQRPSILRKILVNGLIVNIVLCLFGLIGADFVPSEAWMIYGFYLCVVLALFFSAWVYLGHYRGDLKSGVSTGRMVKLASFASLPFLFFGMFWFSIVYAFSDIATIIVGENQTRTAYVTTYQTNNTGGRNMGGALNLIFCRNYIEGAALENAVFSRICFYRDIPGNSNSVSLMDLKGSITPLGFHITTVNKSR